MSNGTSSHRLNFILRNVCLLTTLIAGNAAAADKAHTPTWKYRTHHVSVDVQRDGTTTTRYEYAYTILAESALKSFSEQTIAYHDNDGTLEDVVAYTLKKDGTRINVPESNVQVTSHNGVNGNAPAFSDYRNRRLIFPNVATGDTVVLAYTIKNERATFKNFYSQLATYSPVYVYDDAEFVVAAPKAMGLKYKAYNLAAPEVSTQEDGRQRWKWKYTNLQPLDERNESNMYSRAWHYKDLPIVEISNFRDYAEIAAAYEAPAARRAVVNERIGKLAAEIVGDTTGRREQAQKIYRWTAKEISFAGNCLRGGDVVPRETDQILNMKMGDCKDHATLLQALLASRGIRSTQVLVNTQQYGYELPEVPCWQAFNHVFNYVPEFDVYLDATSSSSPFGVLPEQEYGKPVLLTSLNSGIKRMPPLPANSNWITSTDSVTILADGSIDATSKYQLRGAMANAMSQQFVEWKKSPDFDGGVEYLKREIEEQGYKGNGSYEQIGGISPVQDGFAYGLRYHVDNLLDTGNPYGFTLASFFPNPNPVASLAAFAAADKFSHDFLCHGDRRSEELSIVFPDNVKLLAVPKDVHERTALVQFDATYEQRGNAILVKRAVVDKTPGPICSPDVAAQYARIAVAVKKDMKAQAVYQPK